METNNNSKNNITGKRDMKTVVQERLHKAGDSLERVAETLEKKGFKKIGEALSKAGDKIEHLAD